MTLLKALGKEGLTRFNELLKNTEVIDKPKKKNIDDNNLVGKCNSFDKCESHNIKCESTS